MSQLGISINLITYIIRNRDGKEWHFRMCTTISPMGQGSARAGHRPGLGLPLDARWAV